MRDHTSQRTSVLLRYQQALVDALQSLAERVDSAKTTRESGLMVETSGQGSVVRFVVEAADSRISGVYLFAGPRQCTLGFAEAEVLECHSDPDTNSELVPQIVGLIERYLSGVTLVRHLGENGRVLKTEYFFGLDAAGQTESRIGGSWIPSLFGRVDQTEVISTRLLKIEGAA